MTGGDVPASPGGSIVLDLAAAPSLHLLFRADHYRFREEESAFLFPVLVTGAATTVQTGVRLSGEQAWARGYFDLLAGYSMLSAQVTVGPYGSRDEASRFVLGTGIGMSWLPRVSPVGGFAEFRMDLVAAYPAGYVASARAGVMLRGLISRAPADTSAIDRGWRISRPR